MAKIKITFFFWTWCRKIGCTSTCTELQHTHGKISIPKYNINKIQFHTTSKSNLYDAVISRIQKNLASASHKIQFNKGPCTLHEVTGKWRYSSTYSEPWHWMEACSALRPGRFLPGKETSVFNEKEAVLGPSVRLGVLEKRKNTLLQPTIENA
jgi:hypothetical protein